MPANKYALLRYRIIDRCISNKFNPYPNKEDLREACEEELYGSGGDRISASTIDKDLYAMRNESNLGYFAPIAYSKVEKGYYYEDPDYSIDEMPLNQEDIEAIEFAANTLAQFRGIQLFESSGDAIDKILGRLSLRPTEGQNIEQYVQFETAPEYKGSAHLKVLLKAIKDRKAVSFEYQKFSGEPSRLYRIHPYLLKEYRNRWYVIGFNPQKDATVVFGLDRVVGEVSQTDESFKRRSDFDSDRYFKHSLGITALDEEPEKIVMRFSPLSGKYVESQPWHSSQSLRKQTSTYTEIELFLCITRELVMQILSFGSDVRVLSPLKLREMVQETLKEGLKSYSDQ
ncbi:WYL domain-containing protein [Cryomorphaceae bacterium 1068]|nr:WYL domain-containing protein [Cryomorphaceae bacterium 1068]